MQASALFQLIERLDANKAHPRHRLIVRTGNGAVFSDFKSMSPTVLLCACTDGIVEHTAQALQRITEYSTENINKVTRACCIVVGVLVMCDVDSVLLSLYSSWIV